MTTFYIGRNPENSIVYNSPLVSGRHAEITICDDGQVFLRDYSTNGTIVNGQMVHQNTVPINMYDSIVFPGGIQLDWNLIIGAMPQQAPTGTQYAQAQMTSAGSVPPSVGNERVLLDFSQTLSETFSIAMNNMLSFVGASLLFLLTCWIPYLNIGTYFGFCSKVVAWSKGEHFSPFSIFDRIYRRRMVDYLLVCFFQMTVVIMGLCLCFFPGIVISLATMLGLYICLDKNISPLEAVRASCRMTYGSKWRIFGVSIIIGLIVCVVVGIMVAIIIACLGQELYALAIVLSIITALALLCCNALSFAMVASIYKQLSQNIDIEN